MGLIKHNYLLCIDGFCIANFLHVYIQNTAMYSQIEQGLETRYIAHKILEHRYVDTITTAAHAIPCG